MRSKYPYALLTALVLCCHTLAWRQISK